MLPITISKAALSGSSIFLLFHHPSVASRFVRCPFKRFQGALSAINFCPVSANSLHLGRTLSMDHLNKDKQEDAKLLSEEKLESAKDAEKSVKIVKSSSLKQAVRDYGATVIVFHVCISVLSFGASYAVVSSGLDVVSWLIWLGVDKSFIESRLATGGTTFVVAYAIYKVFSPARVLCTLSVSPFIVRYLRRRGILKTPQK